MMILFQKSIPAVLAGMLLFSSASAQDLALDLFREGRWRECRRECMRIQLAQGTNTTPKIQLLNTACSIRQKKQPPQKMLKQLAPLITQTQDPETAAIASFETARLLRSQKSYGDSLNAFEFSFHSTTNRSLFLQSACSAFLIMNDHKELRGGRSSFIQEINTSRALWYGELFSMCREKRSSRFTPADWFVRFYRSQISPSIGQRCTLEPSCSEYFRQAACRHGALKAVPLIADRFVREPGVNNIKKDPVFVNGMIRYRDPLNEHDFWMNK